jgi:hypothetical protein
MNWKKAGKTLNFGVSCMNVCCCPVVCKVQISILFSIQLEGPEIPNKVDFEFSSLKKH